MLQLRGEEEFDESPEILWQSLANPDFLCRCFPGVDRVVRTDDRSASFTVRPGFSFVRGTLDVAFEFADTEPPRSARLLMHVKGIGSSAEMEASMTLAASGAGTRVNWSSKSLEIGGLLKAVSHGLLQAAAQKVAADTWSRIRDHFDKRSTGGGR